MYLFLLCLGTLFFSSPSPGFAATGAETWGDNRFGADGKAIFDAAANVPVPEGADVIVLSDEYDYSFDAEGRQVHTHYLIYKVLTQKGAEGWDSTTAYWEPWHEERPSLRARVITKDYQIHELNEKAITDSPARDEEESTFGDRRVLRAPLPAIAQGVVVEEERIVREKTPFFSGGTVSRVYFGRRVPVQHERLVIEAPASLPLKYELQLLPQIKEQRSETAGQVRLTFESGPMEALDENLPLFPSDVPQYPSVTFSTGRSWAEIAQTYTQTVNDKIAGSDLKDVAQKVLAGRTTREQKAAAIVQYLSREVRYTGVEFGENQIIPRPPKETLSQRYGDCKDKATLMVAMLREAEIPAYVALLDAGTGTDVAATLPGMGMFDHAIVYVPGQEAIWIDPTDAYARLGQLPRGDQGRWALVASADTDKLIRTPIMSSQDDRLVERREFYLAENGPARVAEVSEPHGTLEAGYRSYYSGANTEERKKSLAQYMKNQYLADKLDRTEVTDTSDLGKQFELTLETNKARRGLTDLSSAVVAIRMETLFGRLPETLRVREETPKKDEEAGGKPKKKRTADFEFSPFVTEWQYTIQPPAGFRPKPLPKNLQANAGPAVLTEEFSADPTGVVHAVLRFDTVKSRISPEEATAMRNQIAQWEEGEPISIYFELTGEALLKEGKMREGFQAYRDMIQLHPKEAVHHLQMADALLQGGLGGAARTEAQVAVSLEPQSAFAQKTLGQVLEFDAVGRKFRRGSDYAGAEKALRAAQKLDPSDAHAAAELGLLLEYNNEGRRYGSGASLREAVAAYRSVPSEELSKIGLKNNIAFALFYGGEFAEAEEEGKKVNPQLSALIVASEAALHGSQAGLAQANQRSSSEETRKTTLKTAGEMLVAIRRYPEAADMLEAGASGENASKTAALAATLRKAKHHEDIQPTADPAGVVTRLFLLLLDKDLTLEKMETIYSRNARQVLQLSDKKTNQKDLREAMQFRSLLARSGVSPDVAVDLALELIETRTEGSDATGYRLRVTMPGEKNMTFFVVKEDGGYRILDTAEKPNAVGLEILDRVDAKNLDGGRALLDWVREDQHLGGGDDPLAGWAFPRFWTKGKVGDAASMRLAAAAILVQTKPTAAQGLRILDPALATSKEPERTNIELALLEGYAHVERWDQVLATAIDLKKAYPDSRRVFLEEGAGLRLTGRFPEADQVANERLQHLPDDLDGMRELERSAVMREDYALAYARDQAILKSGKAEASDKNSTAWYALFKGTVTSEDVETALRASEARPNSGSILHTLGCVYAETGKTKEAREAFVRAMDIDNLDEPNDGYWYGFGRIAQQYGEVRIAADDYAQVKKPEHTNQIPGSVWRLAQIQLKQMPGTGSK
jgi:transglutaminase-like putative cysteine protease/tetratricopeptide (TPR) repeat protein